MLLIMQLLGGNRGVVLGFKYHIFLINMTKMQ